MAMTGGTAVLVKTGYANGNSSAPIRLYVYHKLISQDIETNTSTLSCGMYVETPNGWDIGPWTDYYGSYVGTTENTFKGNMPYLLNATYWLAENQTFTVQHDTDGFCKATIAWKWGVNSPFGQIEIPSGTFTVDLPVIAKASVPTFSTTTPNMGDVLTIYTNRQNNAFTHAIEYIFSEVTGVIAWNVESSYSWEIPITLAAEIPTATSGEMTIFLHTYNNGALVGTTQTPITVVVPNNSVTRPQVTMTVEPVSELPSAFSGLYLQRKSRVRASISASSDFSAIEAYSLAVEGVEKTGNPVESDYLANSGNITVTGSATDARGYKNTVAQTVEVIPYGKPRVIPPNGQTNILCERSKSSGEADASGVYLHIKCGRRYSTVVSGGVQKNFCLLQFRYKTAAAEDFGSGWTSLLGKGDLGSDYADKVLPNIVSDIKTAYTVQIAALDDVGEMTVITVEVPAATVPMHLGRGGKNLGLGQYCDYDNTESIDVGWTMHFNTGIARRKVFSDAVWANGEALSSAIPSADTSTVMSYNLFLAVVRSGADYPMLMVRNENVIAGSFGSSTIVMTYSGNTLVLSGAGGNLITALYELI